ncbi:DUF455 family protein [Pelagicoccus sp. NFK12]|uniref:DUF455 family protein n=1 Tax=Pelagicoccus enzymogenes TaxID=2773457 RepID=A0A927IFQ4_9BACT|nr:DUF455 family protein [Pelagicoccus enzymogenes]MBD5777898.1 DUF455 family protein [Pelagicoccus enzymogenes]
MVSSNAKVSGSRPLGGRMAAVKDMAGYLRALFEVEREFVSTATTLVYRVGDIELKYLLCQHVWEAAGHARFIRERGRELSGFGKGEAVRAEIRQIFEEAISPSDAMQALAGFYKVLKPALLAAYERYLEETNHLADWPSSKLVEEFIADEKRHGQEIEPFLEGVDCGEWEERLAACLRAIGGWLLSGTREPLPEGFVWSVSKKPYQHPATCNRGKYPVCSSVFGHDPEQDPIVRDWLEDPKTDARVVRLMIYVWLMMELDAVDYLATVFYDTRDAPFDLHFDLARHLWDESRHSQFGFRQLPKLGVDLSKLEHSLDLYNILVQMSPAERYAMMTMEFEAGSFPTKAKIMDRVRELNDFEADTLLAFDRNDEQGHVRYGHRWLPEIMKLFGETRPVPEFVEATRIRFEKLAAAFGGKTPHSLSPQERITGSDLLALAKAES